MEGEVFFFLSARYDRFKYIQIDKGEYFGMVDIFSSLVLNDLIPVDSWQYENWIRYEDKLTRQFTVGTTDSKASLLVLSIKDLWALKSEFVEEYEKLLEDAGRRLTRLHNHQIKAIEHVEQRQNLESARGRTNNVLDKSCECHGHLKYPVLLSKLNAVCRFETESECSSHDLSEEEKSDAESDFSSDEESSDSIPIRDEGLTPSKTNIERDDVIDEESEQVSKSNTRSE